MRIRENDFLSRIYTPFSLRSFFIQNGIGNRCEGQKKVLNFLKYVTVTAP